MGARKIDKQPDRSRSVSNRESVHHQPKRMKKNNSIPLWLGLGGVGIIAATVGTFLGLSLTATPLQRQSLSSKNVAFFNPDGKQVFDHNALQIAEVTKPVNILVLGIKIEGEFSN